MAELQWGNLQPPDIVGNIRQGVQFGQQQRALKEQRADNEMLRGLAPGVLAGDPGALSQAAAINPEVAGQYDKVQSTIATRARGAAEYMLDAVKRGNPQEIQGRYQAVLPFLTRLGQQQGKVPPPQFDPAMVPLMEQLVAMGQGGAGGSVQSTYIDGQGNRVAIMRDGSTQVLGQNDAGMANQTISVTGRDGRPRQFTFNKRSGAYEPASMGGQGAPQPQATTQFTGPDGMPMNIGNDIPENVRQDIIANPGAYNGLPDGATAQLPPVNRGPSPFVGRSPEEQAAATTAAQEAAKLQFLPEQERIKTQAAIEQAGGAATAKGEAEARIEAVQALPRVMQESNNAISLIDKALNHPGREGATGLSSMNPLNRIPGSRVMDFQVLLDQIKGGAFLQAFQSLKGGGAITEKEGTKAEQAIARLATAQSDEAFVEGLRELRLIAEGAQTKAMNRVQQFSRQPEPQAPAAGGNDIDALLDKYR